MNRRTRRACGAVLVAAGLLGVVSPAAVADAGTSVQERHDRAGVGAVLDELAGASGGGGVVLRVNDRRGEWVTSAGAAELGRSTRPVPTGRFRAGSITKTFVATTVLQLVGEGRISLDAPIASYLPRYGLDRRITVRMLLQHTSGLFNYTGDVRADGTPDPGIPMWDQAYLDNLFRTYRADELVRFALAKPARFEPGAKHTYSNTNYTLLGLLIENRTGIDYATQVESRILKPLRMNDTVLPGTRAGIPGPHAHGYLTFEQNGKRKVVDITRINPSWAGAAGEIISTTADLDRFVSALLGGKLLKPRLLNEMRTWMPTGAPGASIGLGLFANEFAPGCTAYGHTGGTQSQTSYMYSTADGSRRVEFSVNHGVLDRADGDAVRRIAAATTALAAKALCG
ncbi:serine hydrolase domain-containing protein [Actinokineospora globicatena]|uniref:serine hydrolase domain-containing protein n=1 Tax=Actinokineospora globicatena TaxID=103729 RepID=UPI0020A61462|nr:serine hydrolase domain-containing protein [Actinokineospora globicatena]MCP2302942.1 D-alanyl-D-alanine carboxypeptidase [Actinokineospora globicatena]GLW78671.1 serine hydrolase [Actinokineospora globicatena]GLW84661.1 serine hydrolase [Actinokineospora globicatena]